MKIVLNKCYGGFSISKEAAEFMAERGNKFALEELKTEYEDGTKKNEWYGYIECERNDPDLVAAVETLGSEDASGGLASLYVVEIPDDVAYSIEEYDGIEWIAEKHRTWG